MDAEIVVKSVFATPAVPFAKLYAFCAVVVAELAAVNDESNLPASAMLR